MQNLKKDAHERLDLKKYQNSSVVDSTNFLSLIYNITYPENSSLFTKPGLISGTKPKEQQFFSIEELKETIVADFESLMLEFEELDLSSKMDILRYTENCVLKDNQYIAVIFMQQTSAGKIWGTYALRFEPNVGWLSKKFSQYLCIGENVTWPSNWYDHVIGVYKITY